MQSGSPGFRVAVETQGHKREHPVAGARWEAGERHLEERLAFRGQSPPVSLQSRPPPFSRLRRKLSHGTHPHQSGGCTLKGGRRVESGMVDSAI